MMYINFPTQEVQAFLNEEKAHGNTQAPSVDQVRTLFYDMLLAPLNSPRGGSFEQIAKYIDIRKKIKTAIEVKSAQLELDALEFAQVRDAAQAFEHWPMNFTELVMWIKTALENPEPHPFRACLWEIYTVQCCINSLSPEVRMATEIKKPDLSHKLKLTFTLEAEVKAKLMVLSKLNDRSMTNRMVDFINTEYKSLLGDAHPFTVLDEDEQKSLRAT